MSDVFVSYKAEDRARVAPLVKALEAEGLTVWWDTLIGAADEWRDTIARQLDGAACVIVVWSKQSTGPDGRFVRDEASRALRRGVYLPVRIDKIEPPLGFGETQALLLKGWNGDQSDPRYVAVLNACLSMLGPRPAHEYIPISRGASRRTLIASSGAALIAAATAGWFLLTPRKARTNSIAVLPFANLSGDPAQAYFSDGMAEELRNALSRVAGLKVVARTSSELVRNSDAKTAARKLGVDHILSGSVRRSPSAIRVSAQLIDGHDGLERWSDTFDRPAGDVLKIQTSIAQSVVQALSVQLVGKAREVLWLGGTSNAAAQDFLFQARPERLNDSEAGLNEATRLLDKAIALDAEFAQAHADKAVVLSLLAIVYAKSAAEAQRGSKQALASANRAIEIAPKLARGYAARAGILRSMLDIGGALADLKRADALPGSDAATLRNYAILLAQTGSAVEARRMALRATDLDPLNPVSLETQGSVLYCQRRYAEAAAAARRALQLSPDRVQARAILANSLLLSGRPTEAIKEYQKLEPTDYHRLLGQAVIAARAGDRTRSLANLRSMEQRYGDATLYQRAVIYSQLGSKDQALAALHSALEANDSGMASIRVDPLLDPLRRDARFAAIEAKLNFP